MAKRNVRAKSGKQLYINQSFNRGMLYTASEIPEGYSRILNNLDVTPSGDAVSPRAPFMKTNHGFEGLSKYTYPIKFQGLPTKQCYINFANVVTEKDFVEDNLGNKDDQQNKLINNSINIFSRNTNALNGVYGLDENENPRYDPTYNGLDVYVDIQQYSTGGLPTCAIRINDEINPIVIVNIPCLLINTRNLNAIRYTLSSHEVIDGDTIILNDNLKVKKRLININSPEKNYKWYETCKRTLNNIMNSLRNYRDYRNNAITYYPVIYGIDIYGRQITDVLFVLQTDDTLEVPHAYCVSLSSIIAAVGLAKIDYENNTTPFFEITKRLEEDARLNKRVIWDVNGIDPLYKTINNSIIYENLKKDYDGDFSDLYLDVVHLCDEKHINYDTSNIIDKVQIQYIDYMDAYAFIGRVVQYDAILNLFNIYYKGVIYFKYEESDNTNYFKIMLPTNDLEGDSVSIVDTASNGYNLLNSNPINTENVSTNQLPTSCLGIVPTSVNDPNTVITQAPIGSTVRLRAIMNESFYTYTTPEPILDCELHYTIKSGIYRPDDGHTYEEYTNDSKLLIDKNTREYGLDTYKLSGRTITLSIDKVVVHYKHYNRTYDYTLQNSNPQKYILELVQNEEDTETKEYNTTLSTSFGNIEVDTYNIYTEYNEDYGDVITDFDINIQLNEMFFNHIYYSTPKNVYLVSKWSVANYNSDSFSDITNYQKAYMIDKDNNTIRLETNNDTLDYHITKPQSLAIKFSIVPMYEFNMADGGVINVIYDTQETYTVLPSLNVGTILEYINNKMLTENLNIKDATRLGVVNRQVYLYGPFLKTNTVFFSKFERPWYFSYPYYAVDVEERIKYAVPWNGNLVLFGESSLWMVVMESTVNMSTIHKIYDQLTIADTDIDVVTTAGNNLIFFSNNNGYIATSSKYYDDPTNISVYKLTDNINNCLANPKYIFRSLADVPLTESVTNMIRCQYSIHVDNDYIVLTCNMNLNDNHLLVLFRYNQLYKYWSTYSIHNTDINYINGAYVCEPNIGMQYVVTNGNTFEILYMDRMTNFRKDFNVQHVVATLDTGFLSIDPLNDKRFKDIILDLNNIQKGSIINIYTNFFIDGIPIVLSDNNDTADFEYNYPMLREPKFDEGDYQFKYVLDVDAENEKQQPYGKFIDEGDYAIRVRGRNQLRIPVFGKGRLPSAVFKIATSSFYEIVGYSIIYKEKNVNIRRQ